MAWLPADGWQINAVASTGFRAPNIDDMAKIFDGSNGIVVVPNTELKPEYTYNTEQGVTKSLEDKFKISATLFFTILENPLVQENYTFNSADTIYFDGENSKTQALVNGGSAKIYGGNMQMELAITPELALHSSFTVTRGADSEAGPLRHTTPNFGFLGIRYQQYRFTGEINYQFSGARSYQDLPQSEQQKTHLYTSDGALAWQTLNFSGSYHFSKSLAFTLGVENILDRHYRPYSSGISAPGRNFIAAIKCSLQ
jgi:hemoglobin/transferrin/lactoferrin receptor protein